MSEQEPIYPHPSQEIAIVGNAGDETTRALLAGIAAHAMIPLDATATASFALVLGLAGHAVGWPLARGGSQRIAEALERCLLAAGGGDVRRAREHRSRDPRRRAVGAPVRAVRPTEPVRRHACARGAARSLGVSSCAARLASASARRDRSTNLRWKRRARDRDEPQKAPRRRLEDEAACSRVGDPHAAGCGRRDRGDPRARRDRREGDDARRDRRCA